MTLFPGKIVALCGYRYIFKSVVKCFNNRSFIEVKVECLIGAGRVYRGELIVPTQFLCSENVLEHSLGFTDSWV